MIDNLFIAVHAFTWHILIEFNFLHKQTLTIIANTYNKDEI